MIESSESSAYWQRGSGHSKLSSLVRIIFVDDVLGSVAVVCVDAVRGGSSETLEFMIIKYIYIYIIESNTKIKRRKTKKIDSSKISPFIIVCGWKPKWSKSSNSAPLPAKILWNRVHVCILLECSNLSAALEPFNSQFFHVGCRNQNSKVGISRRKWSR